MESVERLHAWFISQQKTLCCAESLTAGNIQATVCAKSGASRFFRGGVTAYDIAVKAKLLGVDAAHAATVNAVSERVATEMAYGACRLFDADYAIATTGYAEPYAAADVAMPFAFVAIVERQNPLPLAVLRVTGDATTSRVAMQQHVTATALQALADLIAGT